MAFESHKLNNVEKNYLVHQKEMMAIMNYLRVWRHYLLDNYFMIFTMW